mgnify:CR=1 FL=1
MRASCFRHLRQNEAVSFSLLIHLFDCLCNLSSSRTRSLNYEQTMDEEAWRLAEENRNRVFHESSHWPVRTGPRPSSPFPCLSRIGSYRLLCSRRESRPILQGTNSASALCSKTFTPDTIGSVPATLCYISHVADVLWSIAVDVRCTFRTLGAGHQSSRSPIYEAYIFPADKGAQSQSVARKHPIGCGPASHNWSTSHRSFGRHRYVETRVVLSGLIRHKSPLPLTQL